MQDSIDTESQSFDKIGFSVALVSVLLLGLFWFLEWQLAFLLMGVVVISVVIWQACDPFAEAAQWVGEAFHIPGSVRGATLDAVASSLPELFSGIFFVFVAISAAGSGEAARAEAGQEGYGSAIATAAGSAVYNMILIPASCAIVISMFRKQRPSIKVEDEVIARDGLWFVSCEILLILFLFQDQMHWWMGLVYLGLYVVYIGQLYRDATIYRRNLHALQDHIPNLAPELDHAEAAAHLQENHGLKVKPSLIEKAREVHAKNASIDDDDDEEELPEAASVAFGLFEVPLNHVTAWIVLAVATAIAAGACYFLVKATNETALILEVPTFFVAVILAAAASSVPDTFLSIGASMRGDDSGAVSNAFGSNIFDICICLSIPLLVNSYLVGWEPVNLTQDGEPIPGLVGLRILLVTLTVATLAIIWHNRELTRRKAYVLCGLYLIFVGYAVLGSLGVLF